MCVVRTGDFISTKSGVNGSARLSYDEITCVEAMRRLAIEEITRDRAAVIENMGS